MFMSYMYKAEEEANSILTKVDFMRMSLSSNSLNLRKRNSLICNKAIESNIKMIECIEKIKSIDVKQWINTDQKHFIENT
jgi:hypothetical protein